jgi:hypothetical protein
MVRTTKGTLQKEMAQEFSAVDRWWERRASVIPRTFSRDGKSQPFLFDSPDTLWAACCEYFAWMDSRPIYETRPFQYLGVVDLVQVPHRRPYTLTGLNVFLNTSIYMWTSYKRDRGPEFAAVVERVESIMFTQKFEGAAANFFNANIIARELGLRDRQEISGADGGPIETKDTTRVDLGKLSDEDLDAIIDAIDRHTVAVKAVTSG